MNSHAPSDGLQAWIDQVFDDLAEKIAEIVARKLKDALVKAQAQSVPKAGYSKAEVMEMLGISERTLERLVSRNLLRPSRALRRPRFSSAELERFLKDTMPR